MNLIMEPGKVMSFDDFKKRFKHNAIAIDGYVNEPPRYDIQDRLFNLNHHDGCSRLGTRATCAQALMVARMGLGIHLHHEFKVCADDCDEDVCLTCHIFSKIWQAEQLYNPLLNKLVDYEDKLDATCGSYPVKCKDSSFLEICWIFEPYRSFRSLGGLEFGDSEQYLGVVDGVGSRIEKYLVGRAKKARLKIDYEVLSKTSKVAVIKEIGAQCRYRIFEDGIDLYLAVRPAKNGNNVVTIIKKSPFVNIDLLALTPVLNHLEGINPDRLGEWGGGDMVIGSPRGIGTAISIEELARLVESYRK